MKWTQTKVTEALRTGKGVTLAEVQVVDGVPCFEVFIGEKGAINGGAKSLEGAKIIAEALAFHSTGLIND